MGRAEKGTEGLRRVQRKRQKDYEEFRERDRRVTESAEKETEGLRRVQIKRQKDYV